MSTLKVNTIETNTSSLTLTAPTLTSPVTYPVTSVVKTATYVILDNDYYETIFVDTTAGDITITLPLMANNANRKIKIINAKGGTNKVIISPNATDANKLTTDGLASIYLPKVGDYIEIECNTTIGYWMALNERIACVLRLDTYAGYGSTDTKIMQFTNIDDNYGNMFTHNHGSYGVHGLEITIQRSGKYGFSFSFLSTAAAGLPAGFSLNSNQLTTTITSITTAHILGFAYAYVGGYNHLVSTQKYFSKGDIIRPHTGGQVPLAANQNFFIATYLG